MTFKEINPTPSLKMGKPPTDKLEGLKALQ